MCSLLSPFYHEKGPVNQSQGGGVPQHVKNDTERGATDRLSGELRIVEVDTLPELERHSEAWAKLLLESASALPRQSYAWISAFIENKPLLGKRWFCLFAYEGDKLVGVLPLIEVRTYNLPFRPLRCCFVQ